MCPYIFGVCLYNFPCSVKKMFFTSINKLMLTKTRFRLGMGMHKSKD